MSAPVTRRHRLRAIVALVGSEPSRLEQLWIDGKRPLKGAYDASRYAHFQAMAQALSDFEAEAMAKVALLSRALELASQVATGLRTELDKASADREHLERAKNWLAEDEERARRAKK